MKRFALMVLFGLGAACGGPEEAAVATTAEASAVSDACICTYTGTTPTGDLAQHFLPNGCQPDLDTAGKPLALRACAFRSPQDPPNFHTP
jgi:hypothetical protein